MVDEPKFSKLVLSDIHARQRGVAFTPKDFTDIANLGTIRRTLARLEERGDIRRISRGVYDFPAFSVLFKEPSSPDFEEVARAIARAHSWTLIATGETALNQLGLSTQIPAKREYFTDGPTKCYKLTGCTLTFKRRANKETVGLSPKTALVVQAIKALGRQNLSDEVLAKLRDKLTSAEWRLAMKEARNVSAWVYEVIRKLTETKDSLNA